MTISIRTLYLYLFSFIGLFIVVIGAIRLVNLTIKTFIFPDSDRYSYAIPKMVNPDGTKETDEERDVRLSEAEKDITRQRQRELTEGISFILVGVPLYAYHWKVIQQENGNKK